MRAPRRHSYLGVAPAILDRSVAHRRVEFELKRRWLERLLGRSWASALGPVPDDVVRSAASVANATVERLKREAARGVARHDRVKAPAQTIDLDDIA